MKRYFEQLKPQERRWLVAIGFAVFVLVNYFFVWPHFHDWARNDALMARAGQTNTTYYAELRHKDEYQRKINELQSDGSQGVLPEDQAIDFVHFYSSRAISNKVVVVNQGPLVTRTNEFFLEQQMGVTLEADETNLVKFLYSVGAGNSMMRVRAMSLHPNQNHQQLNASVTLVASYQKKTPVRGATTAPAKPATPPPPVQHAPTNMVRQPPAPGQLPPGANAKATEHTNKIAGAFSRPLGTNKPVPPNLKRP